jgi:hypothetical protein
MNQAKFLGRWKPITTGERLLHLLVTSVAELRAIEASTNDWIPEGSRSQSIAEFLHGVVVLHVFGRLLQASKAFRKKNLDNEEKCLSQIENFLIEKMSITRATCDRFDEIAPLALDAARASSKNSHTVSNGKRLEIQEEFRDAFNCYSCGADLDPLDRTREIPHPEKPWRKIPNVRYTEYEHIWPHSFGGDTVVANLAPVCLSCNDAKKNSISWEWALVQSLLPTTDLEQQTLDSRHTSRSIKVSLHMRAAMLYARKHGTTLKDALRTIGPRESSVMVIDADDTPDFFNLMIHNSGRTGVHWEA